MTITSFATRQDNLSPEAASHIRERAILLPALTGARFFAIILEKLLAGLRRKFAG